MKLDPKLATPYLGRGTIRLTNGQLNRVLEDFTLTISLDPRSAHAYRNRGYAHFLLGKLTEAERDFTQAVKLMPTFSSEIDAFVKAMKSPRD